MSEKFRLLLISALGVFSVLFILWIYSNPYLIFSTLSCPAFCLNPSYEENIIQPNLFFREKYVKEIYPLGNAKITAEITKVQSIADPELKLDEIFRWEMEDWHNPNWEPSSFSPTNGSISYFSYQNNISKTRANPDFYLRFFRPQTPDGVFYCNDPQWIAYNKVGACQELSNLFEHMAQKAGIESRTVQTVNHQWAEVKVNGEWKYYDPWCAIEHGYYNATDGNLTFKSKWYNYPEYFRDNCHGLAYINFYNDIVPNPLATQVYSISYSIHDFKKLF
ncbi:transglutaminase domain-containing protein [uncultured Methanoregula sp.]|uniref:transglutaminase domain-containing protein n=1 Tax=uncultured Methanoregula sp. TaxID=1005933 RepID=UPI002AAC330C|nr:transglutaminase domain-containing protein [uncultured Methanoregula sp.]